IAALMWPMLALMQDRGQRGHSRSRTQEWATQDSVTAALFVPMLAVRSRKTLDRNGRRSHSSVCPAGATLLPPHALRRHNSRARIDRCMIETIDHSSVGFRRRAARERPLLARAPHGYG